MWSDPKKKKAMKHWSIILAVALLLTLVVAVAPMSAAPDKKAPVKHDTIRADSDRHDRGGYHPPAKCDDKCVLQVKTTKSTYTYTTTERIRGTEYSLIWKVTCTTTHPYYECQHQHSCSNNKKCEADGNIFIKSAGRDTKKCTPELIKITRIGKDKHHKDKHDKDRHDKDRHDKDRHDKDRHDKGKHP